MENTFDEYQADLIVKFVEAARRRDRPDFLYQCQPPDERPQFRDGLRESLSVDKSDLDALVALGLITNQKIIAQQGHITVQQLAFDVYDNWKNQPEPRSPRPIGF